MRIVALNGSYRRGGVVDTTLGAILAAARTRGAETHQIDLIDRDVQFCGNCRACVQEAGEQRGKCVLEDDVEAILTELEQADGIVLGAPVNFGDVTARTRQLLERMVGYGHWPWHRAAPKLRSKPVRPKPAVLVTASAAPGWMTRLFAKPLATLKTMATLLGAKKVDTIVVGLAAKQHYELDARAERRAARAAQRLMEGA